MVELFIKADFSDFAEPGQGSGPACRQVRNSPRKPRLNEHRARHRSPNPLDGICGLLNEQNLAPALNAASLPRPRLPCPLRLHSEPIGIYRQSGSDPERP